MSLIDEIKARVDIVELIGESVELRRSGKNYIGFCPFHPNTRTPAFVVFPETGTWRCFGACNTGGDVFTFVMKKEGWTFRQALEHLARRAGLSLQQGADNPSSRAEEWYRWMAQATVFYQDQLHKPPGERARAYLEQRGLSARTLEAFALGYAPARGDALIQFFLQQGVTPNELAPLGLVRIDDDTQAARDLFRDRIMFPIRDVRGRTVGFGARTLKPDGIPKYLNSPTTPLFDKSRLLYGLDQAARAIRRKDRVVLVEGYVDVLALHQAGYAETVSPMGTSLTPQQMRRLKGLTRNIYLALDPDPAGEKALWRSLEVAQQTAVEHEPVLDARGLLRYEQRLQLNLRVVVLPEGKDPDEIVLGNPQAWKRLLDRAQPLVLYLMNLAARELDLRDPKQRAQLAQQILPLIYLVENPVEREAYLQALAERVGVPVERLRSWHPVVSPAPKGRTTPAPQLGSDSRRTGQTAQIVYPVANPELQERVLLAALWKQPELLARVQRALRARKQPPLHEEDFQLEQHRQIWRLLQEAFQQFTLPVPHFLEAKAQELRLQDLITHMEALTQPLPAGLLHPLLVTELVRLILHLRRVRVVQALGHVEALLQQSEDVSQELWHRLRELSAQRRSIEQALLQTLTTGVAS